MDPKDLARWAAKFAKKGIGGAVSAEAPRPPAHAPAGPPRTWGPAHQQPWQAPARGATWGGKPPELETLVKPGPSAYNDILANVPELAPDISDGDSMQGPLSAASEAARREAGVPVEAVRPEEDGPPRAFRGPQSGQRIATLAEIQAAGKPN